MTSATLATGLEEAAALRRRVMALEAETARLRGALAQKHLPLETVLDSAPPETHPLFSHSFVRGLLEATAASIKILDPDGRLLFANGKALEALGAADLDSITGQSWIAFWPADQSGIVKAALNTARAGRIARFEAPRKLASGKIQWWDAAVVPVDEALLAVLHDVTDRVEALAAKDMLLRDKDLLMQEVHHRVKNSVQMVQNLLKLQARSCSDKVAAAQLADSAARVHMIGAIHDRLYRSGNTLDVEIRPYLEELVRDLRSGMASAVLGRDILIEADAAIWPAVEVPPLGLVLTELVTNALKYGAGTVRIRFLQQPKAAQLIVEDEGTSLAKDFDLGGGSGLGMRLVRAMLRRPGSLLEMDPDCAHTRFMVHMPRP